MPGPIDHVAAIFADKAILVLGLVASRYNTDDKRKLCNWHRLRRTKTKLHLLLYNFTGKHFVFNKLNKHLFLSIYIAEKETASKYFYPNIYILRLGIYAFRVP